VEIGYFSFDVYWKESKTLDGETVRFIAEMVKRLGAYILGRSIIRREGGKLYNTSFFVDNNGKLIATYDKIHLFGYGSREKELVSRGEEVKVMEMDIGVFGLSTCYDLRFPDSTGSWWVREPRCFWWLQPSPIRVWSIG